MSKIKVRFNLSRGVNYMKWKVVLSDGTVSYHNPDNIQLVMSGCQLKNNEKTSLKIFGGENKSVCAWILCESLEIKTDNFTPGNIDSIKYNPRELPYWNYQTKNMDGSFIREIYSFGKKIFVKVW